MTDSLLAYLVGMGGVWIVTDGIVSIRLYYSAKDETGKRVQSWRYDHSIRLLRVAWGLFFIIAGWVLR